MAKLFSDDFETGGLTAWTGSTTDSGDLSVSAGAKIHGSFGLSALIDDTTAIKVFKFGAGTATRYRVRFYFDPNSISMENGEAITLLSCQDTPVEATAFNVVMRYNSSSYQIFCYSRLDAGTYSNTGFYTITDAPHSIEVDWKASSGVGADDGFLSLYIDGELKETVSGIDNDTENVDYPQLGAIEFTGTPTGTLYFDDFYSNNDGSEIGLIPSVVFSSTTSLANLQNLKSL